MDGDSQLSVDPFVFLFLFRFLLLDDKAVISMATIVAATTISSTLPLLSLVLRLSVKDFDEAAKLRELDECSLARVDALARAVGPLFVLSLLQGL